MIYEFALTPQVLGVACMNADPGNYQALVAVLRDLSDCGIISNLRDGQWKPTADAELHACPWPNKAFIESLLARMWDKGRFVRRPKRRTTVSTEPEWAHEAQLAHQQHPIHALIATSESVFNGLPTTTCPRHALSGLQTSPAWNNREPTVFVPRTETGFKTALMPVLRHARKIALIDPRLLYCPVGIPLGKSRLVRAVSAIFKAAATGRFATLARIEIHANVNLSSERTPPRGSPVSQNWRDIARTLKDAALDAGLRPKEIDFYLWEPKLGGADFHNRAILTNFCAIEVPNGLDLGLSSGAEDRWTLMGQGAFERVTSDFGLNSTRYTLLRGFPFRAHDL
jgi:hypothetical protein